MAKGTRICKVCGKEYEYCRTWNSDNKFRYQDVACSPECGAVYFARIAASRKESTEESEPKKEEARVEVKVETDETHEETVDSFNERELSDDEEESGVDYDFEGAVG